MTLLLHGNRLFAPALRQTTLFGPSEVLPEQFSRLLQSWGGACLLHSPLSAALGSPLAYEKSALR